MATKGQKIRAAKARAKIAEGRQREAAKTAENAKRLRTMTAGFSRSPMTDEQRAKAQAALDAEKFPHSRTVDNWHTTARPEAFVGNTVKARPRYTGELAEREKAAHEVSRARQANVMPLYNKGGLQLAVGDDLKDIQKGLSRRRS